MERYIGLRVVKTAIGTSIAIIIAEFLGLKYATSAGIIAVLSVQNTRKSSIKTAIERTESTIIALFIATILFNTVGFNPIALGIFEFLFIPIAVRFDLSQGIVMSSVLVTHLLGEKSTSFSNLANEFMLIVVGAGIAILLNVYMPPIENDIKQRQNEIEHRMKEIFAMMASIILLEKCDYSLEHKLEELKFTIENAREKSYEYMDNYFDNRARYYAEYMEMRNMQYNMLKSMASILKGINKKFPQSSVIAEYTKVIAKELSEVNNVSKLIFDLDLLMRDFKEGELPKTRREFENRALLFQYLRDLKYLLEIKRSFIIKYSHL